MKTNYQIFIERNGIDQPIAHVACEESDLFRVLLRYAQLTGIDTDFFSARAIVGGGCSMRAQLIDSLKAMLFMVTMFSPFILYFWNMTP